MPNDGRFKLGHVISSETRQKMSVSHSGMKMPQDVKKKISLSNMGRKPTIGNTGIKMPPISEETREKKRIAMTGKKFPLEFGLKVSLATKGKKHPSMIEHGNPNWKGGLSFEIYPKEFSKELKERVRERDGYVCQECGYPQKVLGYKLCIHHIDYNKKNNESSNLISLCRSCHSQTNFERKEWQNYFNKKLYANR